MAKVPHIAIIVLNWNGLQDTKACLNSVYKNSYSNYSVYIVDNASEENELEKIKKYLGKKSKTHFIQNKSNLGFSEGNNVAIRKALESGADYVFTLNNDTEVDPEFLSECIKAIELYPKLKIGIIATKMINFFDHKKLDNAGHDLLSTGDAVPRGRNQSSDSYKISGPRMGACAGAALYSADMLKKIGLFDKDFFLNYEDADLSLRAITRGWQCVYAPKSVVYHKINASIKKIKNSDYRIRSQRNQLWAYLHNTPFLVILFNLPWIIIRDLLILILSFITLRWTITKIFILSRIKVLVTLPVILKKRRKVMKKRAISHYRFWRQQTSWFSTYWQYFQDIVIRRKNSVME